MVLLTLLRTEAALNDVVALRVNGQAEFEQLGRSVASVGDITGDGIPDIAVGLVTVAQGDEGNAVSARIYSGANGVLIWEIPRPANVCSESINSVAGAGDLNGDGRAEFMVGTPRASRVACGVGDEAGLVRVFNGATGGLHSQRFGNAGDLLGWSVAGVGDVNGDGAPDLLMGAPGAGAGAGRMDLVNHTVAAVVMASANGEAAGDGFGWSVAPGGDVSGDSRPDLLVGAPFARGSSSSGGLGAGRAYVYRWPTTGGFGRLFTVFGDGPNDALGYAVAGAGDVNGDGRAEFVAGAPGGVSIVGQVAAGDGYARLYAGVNSSTLRTWGGAAPGPGPHRVGDLFGYALAALGDCDGDGQIEIAVGAPHTGNSHGAVYLFRPGIDQPAAIHLGEDAGDLLGIALSAGGDIWAGPPGRQELLIGASGTTTQGIAGTGSAYLIACVPVPKPDIAVSPGEVDFGDVVPGTDVMRMITIRNEGASTLTIGSLRLDLGAPATITLGPLPALPLALEPGAGVVLAAHFTPVTFGSAGTRLFVTSNDPDEALVSVPLGGRGLAPMIEVIPEAVAFGGVPVGAWASALVTIRNVGNADLAVNGLEIAAGADVFSLFPPVAFVPEQRVTVDEVVLEDGRFFFTIHTIDPPQAHRLEETLDLEAPMWEEVPDVTFVQLPGANIRAEFDAPEGALRFYRVIDTAPAPVVPEGAMALPFTLRPGEERTVHVLFRPDSIGDEAGILRVDSTDPSHMRVDAALTGTGLIANRTPVAAIKAEAALPGAAPHPVNFLGGASVDPDGMIMSYAWDFGDGSAGVGANPAHNFSPLTYDVRPGPAARYVTPLVVTDNLGAADPTSVAVLVGPCPLRSRFYGSVSMRGLPVQENAVIIARIGEDDVALSRTQRHLSSAVYASEVPPIARSAGCALTREGEMVQFLVDGILAEELGVWHHAWDQELNLHLPLNIGPNLGFDWLSELGDVRWIFQPGSVPDVTILDYVDLPAPSHPFQQFAGHAFRITARHLDGTPVNHFDRPFRLDVLYADAEWQSAGLTDEAKLNLYFWNGARWEAILPCASCGLNIAANVLTVTLDHLTDFAFGFDSGLVQSVQVTLVPVADATIASDSPTINLGGLPTLRVGRQSSASLARSLLRFDLSTIPAGAKIESAAVQVFLEQSSTTPATLSMELRRIDTAWQEGTVTWATTLATTGAANIIGVGNVMNYYSWNVTTLVQTWVNGNPNHGVALISQNETVLGWRSFASREQTIAPLHPPRLVITYKP